MSYCCLVPPSVNRRFQAYKFRWPPWSSSCTKSLPASSPAPASGSEESKDRLKLWRCVPGCASSTHRDSWHTQKVDVFFLIVFCKDVRINKSIFKNCHRAMRYNTCTRHVQLNQHELFASYSDIIACYGLLRRAPFSIVNRIKSISWATMLTERLNGISLFMFEKELTEKCSRPSHAVLPF